MNLKVVKNRVVITPIKARLEGNLLLPDNRQKSYQLGEVIAIGELETKESLSVGDTVLLQMPDFMMQNLIFNRNGQKFMAVHVNDIIAKLTRNVVAYENFQIFGRYVLTKSSRNQMSELVLAPDNVEMPELFKFVVLQTGKDVPDYIQTGKEVFPDRGKCNPIGIGSDAYVFIDHQFVYSILED